MNKMRSEQTHMDKIYLYLDGIFRSTTQNKVGDTALREGREEQAAAAQSSGDGSLDSPTGLRSLHTEHAGVVPFVEPVRNIRQTVGRCPSRLRPLRISLRNSYRRIVGLSTWRLTSEIQCERRTRSMSVSNQRNAANSPSM